MNRPLHLALTLLVVVATQGCAVVSVKRHTGQGPAGDTRPSSTAYGSETNATLSIVGSAPDECRANVESCASRLHQFEGVIGDQVQSALSEVYLGRALSMRCAATDPACGADRTDLLIESARNAYLYLLYGNEHSDRRAYRQRPIEVRNIYNRAVQEIALEAYRLAKQADPGTPISMGRGASISVVTGSAKRIPSELIPASELTFDGLRNTYTRDGFGADFVTVTDPHADADTPYLELNYQPITVVLEFDGRDADEVRSSRRMRLSLRDARLEPEVRLAGQGLPLAGNFSAAYGLWLARTDLMKLGMSGLLGRGVEGQDGPCVIMLEPYDPTRRVLILVHGLASSQEAWVNVANEVMGDPALRENFQIWQVVYPTRIPLLVSRARIQSALNETFTRFDPDRTHVASHHAVLVGHSMGGVISRLMVSSSDDLLLDRLIGDLAPDPARLLANDTLRTYVQWTPLPPVSRAVFIAAPHRGTPFVDHRLRNLFGRLIRLPVDLMESFNAILSAESMDRQAIKSLGVHRPDNGVNELAEGSRFMRATATLPMAPALPFHSIIARKSQDGPLEQSSDGLVPYASAHLSGARSESVIVSGHSVQEMPEAILVLREILRTHLRDERKDD